MPTLSAAQIDAVALANGFLFNEDRAIAVAIALAESGGNTTATHKNLNGSTDYGLWQINSGNTSTLRMGDWRNPADNARMAYSLYLARGRKFTDWSTYKSGRYIAFLSVTRRIAYGGKVSSTPLAPTTGTGNGGSAPDASAAPVGLLNPSPLAGLTTLATLMVNPATWVRVAMFTAGGLLLWWGIRSLTDLDNKFGSMAKDIGLAIATDGASAAGKAAT